MNSAQHSTETADPRYRGLDTWADTELLGALHAGHVRAVAAVEPAIPALATAAEIAAARLSAGGRLVYLASGSPALLALGDALEIPQTYGIADDRIVTILAGGLDLVRNFSGVQEDDPRQADVDVRAHGVGAGDCVVAISASGSTPFTVAGLKAAREAGAATVAIASNAGAPLFDHADVTVLLDTGPEVIAGSTRMGAGTAQKAALNMLSTLIATRLGHVYDGMMVNVRADNAKLVARAARTISAITGVGSEAARAALEQAQGLVKPATLIAAGVPDYQSAEALLRRHGGNLRSAMAAIATAELQ